MIINSLLDTDLYKLTMMQAVFHHFTDTEVEYRFKCRNQADLSPIFYDLEQQVEMLCSLRFKKEEIDYLGSLDLFTRNFLDFLRIFQFNRMHLDLRLEGAELQLTIRGSWLLTILFEVPLLAIINELYFRRLRGQVDLNTGRQRLQDKILFITRAPGFVFSDFGTRRRFSREWQGEVIKTLKDNLPDASFSGTSNVYWAWKHQLRPIGTMAHEFLQAGQNLAIHPRDSQRYMLEIWNKEYQGKLGIALTDVISIDAFLRDFDYVLAKSYAGVRQDSGDPLEWGEKIIAHYQALGIDPKDKILVFSDGLSVQRAKEILDRFRGRARIFFGIGTNLTNDIQRIAPLQIVIKMTKCNGEPVAKISDSPEKSMCQDQLYIDYLKRIFKG